MICTGRTRVRYDYSRFGWTRGNGTIWHGGSDEELLDDPTIRMPDYNGKTITGTVDIATIVTDHRDLTWEWGYFVRVRLDADQTPDAVNYLYFCHCARLLCTAGQHVKTGDALAVMGNTGNAALATPPFAHCHFEVRAYPAARALDPSAYTGHPNAVGTYGDASASAKQYRATVLTDGLRLRTYPEASAEMAQIDSLKAGESFPVAQTMDKWAFLVTGKNAGGWACIENEDGTFLSIEEA